MYIHNKMMLKGKISTRFRKVTRSLGEASNELEKPHRRVGKLRRR